MKPPKYCYFRKNGWKYYPWFLYTTSGCLIHKQNGWCSNILSNVETTTALCSSFSRFPLSVSHLWASTQRLKPETPFPKTMSITWEQKHPSSLKLNYWQLSDAGWPLHSCQVRFVLYQLLTNSTEQLQWIKVHEGHWDLEENVWETKAAFSIGVISVIFPLFY